MSNYKLWERFGVEMEFMIVDRDTLNVLPRADVPLGKDKDGNQLSDIEYDDIGLSNELVSHVLEFKCAHPKSTFDGLGKRFFHEIRRANKKLEKINAMLLPSACHPFMDPAEMQLWPYDCLDIYQTYDRIFNCKGHGWANLQSTHLNLSFDGDEEFGELHAAIRLLLPLIPAIAASSPYLDGKYTGYRDARINVYRHNQDKVPEITGQVIPEQAYSYDEYNKMIFDKVKNAIAPYDTEHLLNHFFLNSRGAIARFDRGAIEIRLVDIQECPNADIAIAELEIATLKAIVNGKFAASRSGKQLRHDPPCRTPRQDYEGCRKRDHRLARISQCIWHEFRDYQRNPKYRNYCQRHLETHLQRREKRPHRSLAKFHGKNARTRNSLQRTLQSSRRLPHPRSLRHGIQKISRLPRPQPTVRSLRRHARFCEIHHNVRFFTLKVFENYIYFL